MPRLYGQSLALLTDLYQLTMSYAYWKNGFEETEAVFHLFFRKKPFNGGYAIAAGLESVIEFIEKFRFDESDLAYLAGVLGDDDKPIFPPDFLKYLGNLKFSCEVDAVPEGSVVFPYEPLVRVRGPIIQCQLLESPLLNLINFPSLIATKAARMCIAARGDPILEFGLRRAQGTDGAITASRAAYIGGCSSTSNVLAGKLYGIPVKGTMAHSWVMVYDDEAEAFRVFSKTLPNNCVLLVDTYDTIEGVKKAIETGKWLKQQGWKLAGIRLDSGDLAYLSIASRKMLDEAGFQETRIMASNELDETVIGELKRQGAQISLWGVGTNLVTGKDQPALDGVYKLSAVRSKGGKWKYKLKLSEQMVKVSNPGILKVRRFHDGNDNIADVIYDENTDLKDGCTIVDPFDSTREKIIDAHVKSYDLLVPIFREGSRVYKLPSIHSIRDATRKNLEGFHSGIKRFLNPHQYFVGMEKSLYDLKIQLIQRIRQKQDKKKL